MVRYAHAFIIAYRHDDPRCKFLDGGAIPAGRCGSCGHNVYANQSGIDAIKERDCIVYCHFCAIDRQEYDGMVQDLTLS